MKKLLNSLFIMMAMVAVVGCSEDVPPQDKPLDIDAELTLELVELGSTKATFSVTSEGVDEVRFGWGDGFGHTDESIKLVYGEIFITEPNTTTQFTVYNLLPKSDYTVFVIAKCGDAYIIDRAEITTTEGAVAPSVSLSIDDITETTMSATITSSDADVVAYRVGKLEYSEFPEGELLEAEGVIDSGTQVEANAEVDVVMSDLEPGATYIFYVAASGEGGMMLEYDHFTTLSPAPMLEASLTDEVGHDYIVFNVSAENVVDVRYVCIKAGSRDVTAEQVLKNGVAVESGDVKIEGLSEDTAYEVYVAAKGLNGDIVMAEALTFTTTKNIIAYTMSDSTYASAYQYSAVNYYVTFTDDVNGYTLNADFYIEEGAEYITSGEYQLAGFNAGEISSPYTNFMFTPNDIEATTFSSGTLNVVATPNEETRDIHYSISGELYFANGNYVVLSYSGPISGIKLPEVIEGAPEGAYVFEVSPSTNMPKRVHGSNLQAGEYYIKFYDANWNELTLDLFVDPTLCDNGNLPLPAGIYSTGDGSFDTYSNVSLYNPYFAGSFTEAELQVDKDGDNYTFTLLGTVVSSSTEKLVFMKYTGEIADMVK